MSQLTDPYRIDTPANRRDAEWFAKAWLDSGAKRPLHNRGLHYAFISVKPKLIKPDGEPYLNNDACWSWLERVSSNARLCRMTASGFTSAVTATSSRAAGSAGTDRHGDGAHRLLQAFDGFALSATGCTARCLVASFLLSPAIFF